MMPEYSFRQGVSAPERVGCRREQHVPAGQVAVDDVLRMQHLEGLSYLQGRAHQGGQVVFEPALVAGVLHVARLGSAHPA